MLVQQKQKQIDEAIEKAQNENVIKQAEEHSIRLGDFDAILQPIIDSCTKDSISAGRQPVKLPIGVRQQALSNNTECHAILGKNWILQHTNDAGKCGVLMQYLLKK